MHIGALCAYWQWYARKWMEAVYNPTGSQISNVLYSLIGRTSGRCIFSVLYLQVSLLMPFSFCFFALFTLKSTKSSVEVIFLWLYTNLSRFLFHLFPILDTLLNHGPRNVDSQCIQSTHWLSMRKQENEANRRTAERKKEALRRWNVECYATNQWNLNIDNAIVISVIIRNFFNPFDLPEITRDEFNMSIIRLRVRAINSKWLRLGLARAEQCWSDIRDVNANVMRFFHSIFLFLSKWDHFGSLPLYIGVCSINNVLFVEYPRRSRETQEINAFNYNVFSMSITFDAHCCSL